MNTYILAIKWESEHKAKDLDHLRKWLASVYSDMNAQVTVYLKTSTGGKRFVGIFGKYYGLPVWYSKTHSIVNDCRVINRKTGALYEKTESKYKVFQAQVR